MEGPEWDWELGPDCSLGDREWRPVSVPINRFRDYGLNNRLAPRFLENASGTRAKRMDETRQRAKTPDPASPARWRDRLDGDVARMSQPEPFAGSYHRNLAVHQHVNGPARGTQYYPTFTANYTEEERRQFLVSGERRRRGAGQRFQHTDTLGLQKPLAPSEHRGPVPTGGSPMRITQTDTETSSQFQDPLMLQRIRIRKLQGRK